MRQFEIDDIDRAALGDANAQMRVQRRKDVLTSLAKRRIDALRCATPAWGNKKAIKAFYSEANRLTNETGILHEVDHIVPIQGRKVCGLHVEHNLQILPKVENVRKHASFSDWDKLPRRRHRNDT